MKKRIIALLLVLATMLSLMGSAAPTMIGESAVSESMIEEVAAAPAADEPVCSGCGNADCTCDKSPWELVGEMQSAALIGVFDRSKTAYTCHTAGDKQPVTIDASVCPAYVIIAGVYNHAETGKPMVYRTDSLDDGFYFDTLAPNPYIDASNFTKVMSAEGMYATVSDAVDTVTVYRDLARMTDAKSVSTADLSGEYVVADFCYEPTTCYDWVVKLVPDEAWPEGKEEYVWMTARSLASLSLTPTRYNASENMGKLAVLSQYTKVYGLFVSGNHAEYDSLLFYADEFAADTVLRITDWYWDEETTGLWYQVALENGAFPESTEEYTWPNPAWILQGYTDEIAEGNAALAFVDPELIAIRNELLATGCLEEFEAVLNGLSADVLTRLQASALWYIIEEEYNLLVFSHIYALGTEEEYNAHAAKYPEAWAYIQADEELKQYADMHLERIHYVAENPENSITLGEVVYVTLPGYTNVAPMWGGGVSAGQPYSAEYLSRSGRSSSGSGANTGDNVDNPIDKPSDDSTAGNGVYLGKSLKYENGQYTIRLESYTTGSSVTTVTKKEMPADIVLVLDLSSSMINNNMNAPAYQYLSGGTVQDVYTEYGDRLYVEVDGQYKEVIITGNNATTRQDYVKYGTGDYNASTLYNYINDGHTLYYKVGNAYRTVTASASSGGRYTTYNFYYVDGNGNRQAIATNLWNNSTIDWDTHTLYEYKVVNSYESFTFSYTGADGQPVVHTYAPTDTIGIGTEPSYYIPFVTDSRGEIERAEALKNAVAIFAEQVATKAKGPDGQYGGGDDVAHNVAIVAFSGYDKDITGVYVGEEIREWDDGRISADAYEGTFQDMSTADGVNNVKDSINILSNAQGTATFAGTAMANGILAAYADDPGRYVQDGKTVRSKVVVVFTDGEPYGKYTDDELYNRPIANANIAKNTYGATVYTVGILDEGDTKIPPGNNDRLNKLMHYMSSNYQNATSLNNSGTLSSPNGGYYLLASNADDLNNIFTAISESVNSSQSVVQLNETTEVRDVISPYFKLPDNVQTSAIKVYTSQYLGGDNWGAAQEFPLVGEKPIVFEKVDYKDENGNIVRDEAGNKIQTDALKVTGFDFAEHWVGPVVNNGVTTYHGDKLIIEFPVEVNPDFLGGSNVITNGAESGIYGEKGSEGSITKEEVDIYNQPSANEKVKPITAPVQDRHVYIGSTIDLTSILDLHIVEGNSDKDLAEIADGVNNAYVDITYTITFQNGEVAKYHIPAGTAWTDGKWLDVNGNPLELDSVLVEGDMVFTVSCIMQDINDSDNKSEINNVEGYIYAWTPVVTFKDSLKDPFVDQVNYGGENLNSAVGINWEHPKVKIYVDPAYMLGTADVTIEYTPDADCVAADGTVISRTDFYVNAVVKNNNNVINGVRFMHTDCPNTSCDVDDCSFDATKGEFMIHVASGNLEIKKIVEFVETYNNTPEVSDFRFTVSGPSVLNGTLSYTVDAPAEGEVAERTVMVENGVFVITLKKGQTALFENLPAGSYTVTEDNYSAQGYNSYVSVNSTADANYAEERTATTDLNRSETDRVSFKNKFPVGNLNISKTVTKEFYKTPWNGDTFTFTVTRVGTLRTLLTGNRYDVYEGETKIGTATVAADGSLQVEIQFTAADAALLDEESEKNNSVNHTITIKELPAGTYTVVEAVDEDYNQSERTVSGLVIPASVTPTAEFTNELKRLYGDLEIYKTVEIEAGMQMEENDRKDYFTFYVVLDGDRDFKANVTVQYGNAAGARPTTLVYNETVGGYAVQVADKETVRLIGLPAVDYLVTEEDLTEFNYNPVMQYNDGTITSKGPVRDAVVEGYTPVKVICTNKYPMRYGTLTIIKQIQGEIPANDDTIFVFHVAGTGAGVKGIDVSISAQDVKNGDTSVTIYKMPLGDYIITENTGWSWRYTCTDGAEKTTTIQGGDYGDYNKTVTFTNKLKNNKWLTDTEIEVNRFVSSSTK